MHIGKPGLPLRKEQTKGREAVPMHIGKPGLPLRKSKQKGEKLAFRSEIKSSRKGK
jgi:hypothetical protein